MHGLALLESSGYIQRFGMSRRNDALDHQHIDAWFVTLGDDLVTFQVKSSQCGVAKHMAKHSEIPCLNLGDLKLPAEAAYLIQQTFRLPPLFDDGGDLRDDA
jgi:hypothetical protein